MSDDGPERASSAGKREPVQKGRNRSRWPRFGWQVSLGIWWRAHLRRSAFSHLDQAIAEAGHALPSSWVLHQDRDLKVLRDDDAWIDDTRELSATRAPVGKPAGRALRPDGQSREGSNTGRPPPPLRYPARPWPKPTLRAAGWAVLTALCAVGVVWLTDMATPWLVGLGILVVFSARRIYVDNRERRDCKQLVAQLRQEAARRGRVSRRP
jgi:hypothetical protein